MTFVYQLNTVATHCMVLLTQVTKMGNTSAYIFTKINKNIAFIKKKPNSPSFLSDAIYNESQYTICHHFV